MDLQTTAGMIDLGVKAVTVILMVIASWMAIKRKNNLILGVAIVGNLVVYYFTQSPLLCWVVSIGCMIWAGMIKGDNKR